MEIPNELIENYLGAYQEVERLDRVIQKAQSEVVKDHFTTERAQKFDDIVLAAKAIMNYVRKEGLGQGASNER